MMKKSGIIILLTIASALLSACVDMKNVDTFSGSVVVVTDATGKMIAADRASCTDLNAMIAEFESLPKIGKIGAANCDDLGKILDSIAGVNEVLGKYGKALGDISQDTYINYDTDVTALQEILRSLPAASQPSQDQINAATGLAGWVASIVTQQQRDRAIKNAMIGKNGEMEQNFHKVVALLKHLAVQYEEGIETKAHTTRMSLNLVAVAYGSNEPVAVAELSRRLAGDARVSDEHKKAIKAYIAALDAMNKAFDAATEKQSGKALLEEVRDFAKRARTVHDSIAKAFPGI